MPNDGRKSFIVRIIRKTSPPIAPLSCDFLLLMIFSLLPQFDRPTHRASFDDIEVQTYCCTDFESSLVDFVSNGHHCRCLTFKIGFNELLIAFDELISLSG